MRKCEVFKRVNVKEPKSEAPPYGTSHWEEQSIGIGKFVMYGLDCDEAENGIASFTSAIVEMPDGTVENVCTNMIKFVTP